MMAPFIVELLGHKSALGAFLPRQVRTKSANEASERERVAERKRGEYKEDNPGRPRAIKPADKATDTQESPTEHSNYNVCKTLLKQMASIKKGNVPLILLS